MMMNYDDDDDDDDDDDNDDELAESFIPSLSWSLRAL